MTDNVSSTSAAGRPRVRRGLGLLVGATMCVTPLALAPAASAQTGNDPLGGLGGTLAQTVQALPSTLGDPLGGDNARPSGNGCTQLDGIGPFLTCVVDRLDKALGGQRAQARVKARAKSRVLRATSKVRWVMR